MKKYHVFLLLAVAIGGFAFTRLKNNTQFSAYKSNANFSVNPADSTVCDTVSFNARIAPVFYQNCVGCHEGISDYKSVSEHAGHILKSLKGDGASQMPKDAKPLEDAFIKQFTCWIEQGKKDN